MKAGSNSLDLVLNTVAANHQILTYLPLLVIILSLGSLGLI